MNHECVTTNHEMSVFAGVYVFSKYLIVSYFIMSYLI